MNRTKSESKKYSYLIDLRKKTIGRGWSRLNGTELCFKHHVGNATTYDCIRAGIIEKHPYKAKYYRWVGEEDVSFDMVDRINEHSLPHRSSNEANLKLKSVKIKHDYFQFITNDMLIAELIKRGFVGQVTAPKVTINL